MPTIYLSPSTQPYNLYATGGSEQDFMNALANEMESLLTASGIKFDRKNLNMSAADAIKASNSGRYDLHLGLHSNASPENIAGTQRGVIVFYNPSNIESKRAATLIADAIRNIYPLPNLVKTEPSTTIGEVRRVNAPSAFLEIGYHDNPEDAVWISNNIPQIAQSIVSALSTYFQTPFLSSVEERPAEVDVNWGQVNIRERPSIGAPILATAVDGTPVTILNEHNGWYLIRFGNVLGYANKEFIRPL